MLSAELVMKRSTQLKNTGAGFLFLVFALGLASLATPKREIFPFFSWFLFSEIPYQEDIYYLVIYRQAGVAGALPVEADEGVMIGDRIKAGRVIKTLALAAASEDTQTIRTQKIILESRYLAKVESYAVWVREQDPLEQWKGIKRAGHEAVRLTYGEAP